MATVNIYLTFDGNCEEAFSHYKHVFGKDLLMMNRFSEMPPSPEMPIPAGEENRIMHVTLPIGGDTVLMGSDKTSNFGAPLTVGNNFSISIAPESREQADAFFNKLSEGGEITMPMADTFWDAYYGMCTDQFGIQWMINFTKP